MKQNLTKKQQKTLVLEVQNDFKRRQEEKKYFETKWQQNINYLLGNQNSFVGGGEFDGNQNKFYWPKTYILYEI